MGKAAFDTKRSDIFWFYPEKLHIEEDETSILYDERIHYPVDEDLVLDIMLDRQGVIKPVLVVKDKDLPPDEAILLDGRRRVRAAREANKRFANAEKEPLQVPAILKRGDDKMLLTMMLSANEHHAVDSVVVKARKAAQLINCGRTVHETAIVFGVAPGTIRNWLYVIELDPHVQKMIESNKISPTAAIELRTLSAEEQRSKADEIVNSGQTTVAAVKNSVSTGRVSTKNRAPRIRSRKEITAMLELVKNNTEYKQSEEYKTIAHTLNWVLRETEEL